MLKDNIMEYLCVELKFLIDMFEEVLSFLGEKLKEELSKICSKVECVLKESCYCLGEMGDVIVK